MSALVSAARFAAAQNFTGYLKTVRQNAELWAGVYRTASVPVELLARARSLPTRWHLLALSEDWCGDAVNSLPVLAKLTEQVPLFDLRFVGRDDNPDLMDAHLTGLSRSIPVVMVLDSDLEERGWWGPRPAALQAWFDGEEAQTMDKDERYTRIRTWYARDRGRTILDEVLRMIERSTESVRSA